MKRGLTGNGIIGVCVAAMPCVALADAPIDGAFSYQGRLTQAGRPAAGQYAMDFALFDAASGGAQIGATISFDVTVENGLFTVLLNDAGQFGPSAFNGRQRFLQITVEGIALVPRQELTIAPYAQYAVNADTLDGLDSPPFLQSVPNPLSLSSAQSGAFVIRGVNSSNSNQSHGLFGQASGTGGGIGIWGQERGGQGSVPTAGAGVLGTSDTGAGVAAFTRSGDGLFALSSATTGNTHAVFGDNRSSSGIGVLGWAKSATGAAIGVMGQSDSPDGFAGYFEGRSYFSDSVGIGTETPTALLDLAGTAGTDGIRFPDGSLQTTAFRGNALDAADGNPQDAVFVDAAGHVGINTQSPTQPLHIVDSLSSAVLLDRTGGSQVTLSAQGSTGQVGTATNFPFRLLTNNTVRATLDTQGFLGVGTTTPSARLTVDQTAAAPIFDVKDSGSTVLTVADGGNVGIGTSSPAARLTVNQTAAAPILDVKDSGTTVMMVADGGNVGIGTSNPTGKLHVSGSAGDGTVVLPDDSIGPGEMFAEAGLASRIVSSTTTLPKGSTFTLCSRTITCPTSGYVLAIGTVEFIGDPLFGNSAVIGILTSDTDLPSDQDYLVRINSYESTTVQSIRSVSAGNQTFYFQAESFDDGVVVEQRKLSLIFLPTAYGSVNVD